MRNTVIHTTTEQRANKRGKGNMLGRILKRIIDHFTADDALSDRLSVMEEIEYAIDVGNVEMVRALIKKNPDKADPRQKAWLEQKLKEKGDQP